MVFTEIWDKAVQAIQNISGEEYMKIIMKAVWIILIFVASKITSRLVSFFIKKFFKQQSKVKLKIDEQKAKTMEVLLINILRYVIGFVAIVMILEQCGVEIGPLLTAAGVGGVAIAFGAQSLVRDIITGFFILFEDQYAVGDYVTIGEATGTVEEMGLRITKIRGYKGEINIIPNGQVDKVTNYSRSNSLAIVDMGIAYESDIDRASGIMKVTAEAFAQEHHEVVEPPEVLGVMELGDSQVVIRLIARTQPMKHWGVERELRKQIKLEFDRQGIEIPYPHRVMVNK